MAYSVKLRDAYKRFTFDQDKILPPEETVRRFREKLKTLDMDILKRAVRIDNGRLDIPVFFSVCGHDARRVSCDTARKKVATSRRFSSAPGSSASISSSFSRPSFARLRRVRGLLLSRQSRIDSSRTRR